MATQLTIKQMRLASFMVPHGTPEMVVSDQEGEILWRAGLTPGVHEGRKFMQYLNGSEIITVSKTVTVMLNGRTRVARVAYGERANESGANPDFVPTNATQQEVRMRKLLKDVNSKSDKLERQQRGMQKVLDEKEAAEKAEKLAAQKAAEEKEKAAAAEALKTAQEAAAAE